MNKFYIGQKVVCIGIVGKETEGVRPCIKGEIYTINDILTIWGGVFFCFNEMPQTDCYLSLDFRPLLDDSQEYADNLIKELETEINEENLILK